MVDHKDNGQRVNISELLRDLFIKHSECMKKIHELQARLDKE